MLTAIGSWLAAAALWTVWGAAVLLTTAIAGSIFYWLLTDDDNPSVITVQDHSDNTRGRERASAAGVGFSFIRRRTRGMA